MAQHPRNVVLLDLDGTLTKSDGGIIASVIKTFEELGRPVPDDAELHRFIGPAIIESLRRNHVPEEELDRAVIIYRSYYADRAVFDDPNEPGNKVPGRLVNVVFPGIREQLLKLRADGYYLALASCKPNCWMAFMALPRTTLAWIRIRSSVIALTKSVLMLRQGIRP